MERQELQRRRSALLLRYASATEPSQLEDRAQELGFGPWARAEYIVVDELPSSHPSSALPSPDCPLALIHARHATGQGAEKGLWPRLLSVASDTKPATHDLAREDDSS
jgi:hypothetical protein